LLSTKQKFVRGHRCEFSSVEIAISLKRPGSTTVSGLDPLKLIQSVLCKWHYGNSIR